MSRLRFAIPCCALLAAVSGCSDPPAPVLAKAPLSEEDKEQEAYNELFRNPKTRAKILQHPIFQESPWVAKDGSERDDRDDAAGLDAADAVLELKLNGATVTVEDARTVTGVNLLHGDPAEPRTLVDAGLVLFKLFPELKTVVLYNTAVTDHGLRHLATVTSLTALELGYTATGDDGLARVKNLTALETLGLTETRVTDVGLAHLKGMTKLRVLSLNKTAVTDAGLIHLEGLTALKDVRLALTKVSDKGVARLRKALPGCEITR